MDEERQRLMKGIVVQWDQGCTSSRRIFIAIGKCFFGWQRMLLELFLPFIHPIYLLFPIETRKHQRRNGSFCSLPIFFVSCLHTTHISIPSLYYHVIYDWNPFSRLAHPPFLYCLNEQLSLNMHHCLCSFVTCSINIGSFHVTRERHLGYIFLLDNIDA